MQLTKVSFWKPRLGSREPGACKRGLSPTFSKLLQVSLLLPRPLPTCLPPHQGGENWPRGTREPPAHARAVVAPALGWGRRHRRQERSGLSLPLAVLSVSFSIWETGTTRLPLALSAAGRAWLGCPAECQPSMARGGLGEGPRAQGRAACAPQPARVRPRLESRPAAFGNAKARK